MRAIGIHTRVVRQWPSTETPHILSGLSGDGVEHDFRRLRTRGRGGRGDHLTERGAGRPVNDRHGGGERSGSPRILHGLTEIIEDGCAPDSGPRTPSSSGILCGV
jgi:hypothetical protein